MNTCIDLMRTALVALASGGARQLVRPVLPLAGRAVLGMMPAYVPASAVAGVKVLTVFPDNLARGRPSHQGLVVLFETATGAIRAVVDAESITAIRTAAASAAATDALARPDASALALIGTGVQAWQHLRAMALVRHLRSVYVWGRTTAHATRFADLARRATGIEVEVFGTPAAATARADIVCTLTAATEPLLTAADVRPGTHVNAVGSCTPATRELGSDLVAAGRLFVDWAPAALTEAGDLLLAIADGAVTEDHVLGEVGAVLAGTRVGRASADDITIFEALGQAIEDVIAANHVAEALSSRSWQAGP